MDNTVYDVIILGGGPAGLTAGIYASRSKLKALLIEKMGCGGQAVITDLIENYPGFPEGINGFDLAAKLEEQARKFGLAITTEEVMGMALAQGNEKLVTTDSHEYRALSVIIATGANPKKLGAPGEVENIGKGVSYCATCDGPFYKDKKVVVVGGGDSAVQEAIYLTRFAREVTLVHRRDRLRATRILQDRLRANPKITLRLDSVVSSITGNGKVERVALVHPAAGTSEQLAADGVFVFVGYVPNTGFITQGITLDEWGYIITDDSMKTSTAGVFACGDVRHKLLKQVVTATGEGATAAFAAQEYVDELKGTAYTFKQ